MDLIKYLKLLFQLSSILLITTFILSPTAQARAFQNPLIVTDAYIKANGNVITGNYEGTTKQAAITVATSQPVIIDNSVLQGPGDMIQALTVPANITVMHTTGTGTNPNVRGMQKGIFLHVNSFANINMQNNNITGMRIGFYCEGYAGKKTSSNTLVIDYNLFSDLDARPSDGKGSYETTGQYNGQAIHLGNIFGVPGMDIGWNEVMNTAEQSSSGAIIEINESSGTSTSPMRIHNNYISGAFPTDPGKDLYDYGGILVNGAATDTATTASSFINIAYNVIVATANYGIAVVAGHDITVTNNRVISSGFLPDGVTFYPMSTYGDAAGAININLFNQPATVFFNNSVTANVLGLIKNNGSNKPIRSDWNLPGQGGAVEGNTNYLPDDSSDPTTADEVQEFASYQLTLTDNQASVGTATDVGYVPDSIPLTPTAPVNISTSGPLVLDHVLITSTNGDCVNVQGLGGQITITNSVIGPCTGGNGRGIHVSGAATAVIQNNYVHDAAEQGISIEVVGTETIQNNTIENSGFGIYVASNNNLVTSANVDYNKIINVVGIPNQGSSAIQWNQISGPGNSISCNTFTELSPPPAGSPGDGDSFSLFLSSGTADSPIQVVGNRIWGGGDAGNGGGIMLADGDTGPGTPGPGNVYAGDNLLENPGGYGIDVSTGHDIVINANYVYGDNYDLYNPANDTYGPGGIGINTFNFYTSSCSNITVTNNTAYYLSNRTRGAAFDYGLNTTQCSPTFQSNNIGYNLGDTFTFPSVTVPRPSCLTTSH